MQLKNKSNLFCMKRILFVALCVLYSLSTIAGNKDVIMIDTNDDNGRIIITKAERLYSKSGFHADYHISAATHDGDTIYSLILEYKELIPILDKGKKLLLKLENGDIVVLTSDLDNYRKSYEPTLDVSYSISIDDLKKIASNEVVKVRIETNTEFLDREVKKFNKNFSKLYEALFKRLKENQSIFDNF